MATGGRCAEAAAATGLTIHQCARRAAELGLIFTRERQRWTQTNWTRLKGGRTAPWRQFSGSTNLDGFCQEELAAALGVSKYQVGQWRERRMLKMEKRPSIDTPRGSDPDRDQLLWFYHNRHIR